MERLDPHKARLLTHMISPHYPNQRIMLITDGRCDLHATLFDFTKQKEFEFEVRTVGCELEGFDTEGHAGCRLEVMGLRAPRYNRHAKQYENIYLTLHPSHLEKETTAILKKLYAVIKNAGVLTVMVEKGAPLLKRLDAELEKSNFVAIGHVDIFDDYEVVTAKKLHGWGS
ncbi:hypothetical protein [Hydrogenimonas sp.]